jgi:hypothetical protein
MHQNTQSLTALADPRQHFAYGVAIFRRHIVQQFAPGQVFIAPARGIQRLNGGAVGFDDPEIGCGYDHDGFVGSVEHQPITRLDFT